MPWLGGGQGKSGVTESELTKSEYWGNTVSKDGIKNAPKIDFKKPGNPGTSDKKFFGLF